MIVNCELNSMNFFKNKPLSIVSICLNLLVLLVLIVPIHSHAQTFVDKIVVIVNDDVITEGELLQRIKRVQVNNNLTKVDRDLHDQILKNMVEELVQLQRAKQIGISTSEAEVDRLVQRFARQRKVSLGELENQLIRQGLSYEDFRQDLKTQSIVRKLVRSDAARSVTVTDEEIDTFTKANNIKSKAVAYDVSYLFIKAPDGSSEAEQDALLTTVTAAKDQLDKVSFSDLTVKLAESKLQATTQNLGLNPAEKLPSIFNKVLSKMVPGNYSDAFKTSSGIYVLKLNNVQGGAAVTEKRKAQHILITAKSQLEIERAKKVAARLKSQVAAGADFTNVAKYYSDDSTSAATGGNLGWVRAGQMVPRFESALFALQEGQISDPVVTNFGVHIIKLNEISREANPEEELKAIAFNNLMSQKVDQYYPAFLSQLMGRAYIKYL